MRSLLTVGLVALCVSLIPQLNEACTYDQASVLGGELWRLGTCQLSHFGAGHLAWNLGAFALLGAATVRHSRRAFVWCVGLGLALIPAVVVARHPELEQFRGLSGVDSALFAYLTWVAIARSSGLRRGAALLAGALFTAKVGWEAAQGTALFARDASFVVVPAAHAAGALIGCLVAAIGSITISDLRIAWSGDSMPCNPYVSDAS